MACYSNFDNTAGWLPIDFAESLSHEAIVMETVSSTSSVRLRIQKLLGNSGLADGLTIIGRLVDGASFDGGTTRLLKAAVSACRSERKAMRRWIRPAQPDASGVLAELSRGCSWKAGSRNRNITRSMVTGLFYTYNSHWHRACPGAGQRPPD
jgi:hypothetical protein